MNILFLHYSFKNDGVTRALLNSIRGLKELHLGINFIAGVDSFSASIPEYVEKKYIDWSAQDIVSQIKNIAEDADVVIIENPTVGMYPRATFAFKEYSEKNLDKKIIYRIHDLIDDRPHLFEEFRKVFDNFDEIYPTSENVSFLALTSFDKKRLIDKGLKNVNILPNSIILSDLSNNFDENKNLREVFESEKIVNPGEKILVYPVRVEKRKNIEEALLITKLLNESGGNYRLIVTIPYLGDYMEELEHLAKEYDIPCSIGRASKYISFSKEDKFTIVDLYSISDLVISTSVREGFGFTFIEPWIAGIPVIGRKISSVTEDFEINGINLNHLYGNNVLHNDKDPKERLKKVKKILSNPEKLKEFSKRLDLKNRISQSQSVLENNREAVKKYYDHINVAKQFLDYIKLPTPNIVNHN